MKNDPIFVEALIGSRMAMLVSGTHSVSVRPKNRAIAVDLKLFRQIYWT